MNFRLFNSFILITFFLVAGCNQQQETAAPDDEFGNRKSPIAIANTLYEGTYIKIVYGQPYRRGRTVFGELESYGNIWRTGANEATEITVTESILMGDQEISPGTYTLFTIPNPESWTIILNNELGQWGAFNYDESKDYVRMDFPVINLEEPVEAFTIQFSTPENSATTLTLKWDLVQVDIPVNFKM